MTSVAMKPNIKPYAFNSRLFSYERVGVVVRVCLGPMEFCKVGRVWCLSVFERVIASNTASDHA